jgi:DNA-binding beta-propeller fold protein YncE
MLFPRSLSLAIGAVALVLTGGLALGAGTVASTLPDATRGPQNIAFTPNGVRALVTESDSGTLAVLERASGKLEKRIDLGEKAPVGVTALSDDAALVTSPLSGSVLRVNLNAGRVASRLRLLGEPTGVAKLDDRTAFVSVSQLDQVAVLDLPSLAVRARIAVGRRPQAMALTPDGRTLLVAGFQDGTISFIDTATLKETRRLHPRGINLRGVSVSPSGRYAYLSGQVPAETRVTWVANDVWINSLFRLDLERGAVEPVAEGRLDTPNAPCPDPGGIAALSDTAVALAVTGGDEALLVDAPNGSAGYFEPKVRNRSGTGAQPRGLALTPDRREIWAAESIGSSLAVFDARDLHLVRRLALPATGAADPALRGRYLFANAGMTAGRQFTCNSCHPDGHPDGQTWQFVHVPDGIPDRNTRSLLGGVAKTAPFRWSGREREIGPFLQDEVTGLLHGHEQSEATLAALGRYLESLPLPPNP